VQVSLSIYTLFGLQVMLLPFQLISYLSRTSDHKRKRFLQLSLLYVLFNSLWIFSFSLDSYPNILQGLLLLVGFILIKRTYNHIYGEIETVRDSTVYLNASVAIALIGFYIQNTFFSSPPFGLLIGLLLYCELLIIRHVRKLIKAFDESSDNNIQKSVALIASISFLLLPIGVYLVESPDVKFISLNVGFLILTFGYLHGYVKKTHNEWVQFESIQEQVKKSNLKAEKADKFAKLTARETEVAELILQKLLFKEIAEELNISISTATKHAANIYAKFGVSKREEFLEEVRLLNDS
jgi:DNA-binding CsgD family transcriptional regulator